MKDRIPTSMMTQHPDSASRYVPIQEEPEEAIIALTPEPEGLGIEEVMIDFEGKLTPYHQTAQIALGLLRKGVVPGQDVFITPRIPSQSRESAFKQLMALLSAIETNVEVLRAGGPWAVREVILPMCETAQELIDVRLRILHVLELAHKEFGLDPDSDSLRLIPLVEEVPELMAIDALFDDYAGQCEKMNLGIRQLRYMVGRSDPALAYGLVPSVLANKMAVARGYRWGNTRGVEVYPILGAGASPFRGHVTLEHLPHLLEEYRGVRTVTLQSAIRYDHGEHKARQLAAALKKELPCRQPLLYSDEECAEMSNFIGLFTIQYLDVFSQILPTVCRLSDLLPRQRDRLARISPVGYARDQSRPERLVHFVSDAGVADELKAIRLLPARDLPRAITFTGALYSIGLPPEIIGTGRGLKAIHQRYGQEALDRLLSSYYPGLASDLRWAACFVHLKAAAAFLPEPAMGLIRKDLRMIHHYLDIAMGTPSEAEKRYRTMVARTKPIALQAIQDEAQKFVDSRLIQRLQTRLIEMGKLRGTLG